MYPEFKGDVQARFQSSEREILRDLFAVIQATQLKPVKLTKSGIPPKPLWGALNQRLVWKDPSSILYDWEEVDQVRFVYLLAVELDLVRPDSDYWLELAPGADQLFLADPVRRAHLIKRAFFALEGWDERCDARDEQGHRYNFGRAFRRDFIHHETELRECAWQTLAELPKGWTETTHLAKALSDNVPDLLLSEVCEPAQLDDESVDTEKLRFVNFWLTLLARFGWTDIARAPGDDASKRLCRLTPLGSAVVRGTKFTEKRTKPLTVDESFIVRIPSDGGDVTDCYVMSRLGVKQKTRSDQWLGVYQLTRSSLTRAADSGVDIDAHLGWLDSRLTDGTPGPLSDLFDLVSQPRQQVRIIQNVAAVEFPAPTKSTMAAFSKRGISVHDNLAVAAGAERSALFAAAGTEPEEAFSYPALEPLAAWGSGPTLQFYYSALPLQHRALLDTLTIEGDPPTVTFTPAKLADLKSRGWTMETLAEALQGFTQKKLPPKIRGLFEEVLL